MRICIKLGAMIVNNIKDEISKELSICDAEIRKAREEIIRLTERKVLFDDRKTMLYGLLQALDRDDKEDTE